MASTITGPVLVLTRDDAYRLVGPIVLGLEAAYPDQEVPVEVEELAKAIYGLALREAVSTQVDISDDVYVSIEEAAALLRCSIKTVRRRIKAGLLPAAVDSRGAYLLNVEDL